MVSTLIKPPFPKDAPVPGNDVSNTVTLKPARVRRIAIHRPMIPAPTMVVEPSNVCLCVIAINV
jgi:hypothetical protein